MKSVTINELQLEKAINIEALQDPCAELHPAVQSSLQAARTRSRLVTVRGNLPNFTECDYDLVTRSDFHAGEKLALRWRGPRRILKPLNEYVFQVENLRYSQLDDVHGSLRKLYSDYALDKEAIMPHVLFLEIGMPVARLMERIDSPDGLQVRVRRKGLPNSNDTFKPI